MNYLRTILCSLSAVVTLTMAAQPRQARPQTLMSAKNLTIATKGGQTYYYLVSNASFPIIRLQTAAKVQVANDEFDRDDISSMRFRSLTRFVLDEDSTSFDRTMLVDHGLMALRRSLKVGLWNSIVLPVSLTGSQITDAFGEGTEVCVPRGFREGDNTVVEFELLDLATNDVVTKANNHYLIRPTREADVAEGSTLTNFLTGQRLQGPLYFIPNASITKANSTPVMQNLKSDDEQAQIRFRGTYTKLDGSVLSATGRTVMNKKIGPDAYVMTDDGGMLHTTDSTEVKAFTSWILDMSVEPKELTFFIDGVAMDLTGIADLQQFAGGKTSTDPAVYDMSGRRIAANRDEFMRQSAARRPGVYIISGKKVVIK